MSINKIPEGYTTITPSLVVKDAAKAIELYTKAFGAKETGRATLPNSDKIMHACLEIGTSKIFLADANEKMGCGTPTSASFYLYVDDVDAAFKQAKQAGLQETFAPKDMFWGDRSGSLKDSFGNSWTLATHTRDVSKDEIEQGKKEFAAKAA